jgi:tetratricopeptide (TPR) repeat protein
VPSLPEEATPLLLAEDVRRELRGLTPENAEFTARHLAAAGLVIDDDPELALGHARAARSRAARLASVREAVGLAAYAAGDYTEARVELRAARRISGSAACLPVLADCERALGHPEQALTVAADPQARTLDDEARVELAIVVSGARRDLGQPTAAVAALEGRELADERVRPWTVRLWYAYAEALLAAGRVEEAQRWFAATTGIDDDDLTDAAERSAALADPATGP